MQVPWPNEGNQLHMGCNHAAWTLRMDGFIMGEHSIFDQAGLNIVFDCQLIARHGSITKLGIWSTLVSQDKALTPA